VRGAATHPFVPRCSHCGCSTSKSGPHHDCSGIEVRSAHLIAQAGYPAAGGHVRTGPAAEVTLGLAHLCTTVSLVLCLGKSRCKWWPPFTFSEPALTATCGLFTIASSALNYTARSFSGDTHTQYLRLSLGIADVVAVRSRPSPVVLRWCQADTAASSILC
jgi:hypothetical protein